MANIIIKSKTSFGKTRSEQEGNLRKEWGPTLSDEHLDKIKFIEKKAKGAVGSDRNFVGAIDADNIK